MIYNTKEERLPLPEYGRTVQNMVDHALTIQNRNERQHCAETIIDIMERMFPKMRELPDYKRKLWDHLAIMSNFKLDIDYPYEVFPEDKLTSNPEKVPYNNSKIRFRHYGRTLEQLIAKACEMPESNEKNNLLALICNHMFKCYPNVNADTIYMIDANLNELSHGKLYITDDLLRLMDVRNEFYQPQSMEEMGKAQQQAQSNQPKKKKKKKKAQTMSGQL